MSQGGNKFNIEIDQSKGRSKLAHKDLVFPHVSAKNFVHFSDSLQAALDCRSYVKAQESNFIFGKSDAKESLEISNALRSQASNALDREQEMYEGFKDFGSDRLDHNELPFDTDRVQHEWTTGKYKNSHVIENTLEEDAMLYGMPLDKSHMHLEQAKVEGLYSINPLDGERSPYDEEIKEKGNASNGGKITSKNDTDKEPCIHDDTRDNNDIFDGEGSPAFMEVTEILFMLPAQGL